MKNSNYFLLVALMICMITSSFAQVQIDQSIQLTGGAGLSAINGIADPPVNGTDAANKSYVDAAVAATGGGSFTMVSDESSSAMSFGDAIRYCKNLSESTYSDWKLPTFQELVDVVSKGGTSVSSDNSSNYIWFQLFIAQAGWIFSSVRLSDGDVQYVSVDELSATYRVRCVR